MFRDQPVKQQRFLVADIRLRFSEFQITGSHFCHISDCPQIYGLLEIKQNAKNGINDKSPIFDTII